MAAAAYLAAPADVSVPTGWERLDGPYRSTLDAVVRGLEAAPSGLLGVVDGELRAPSAEVLRQLAAQWRGEAAVLPLVDERVRPLHGVYAATSLDGLRRLRQQGARSVLHAVSALSGRVVGAEVWGEADADGSFAR